MNSSEIYQLLPYGPNFIFLNKVVSLRQGKSITTSMMYEIIHPIIMSHFEKGPYIVPGVVLVEQICQSALLLGLLSDQEVKENEILVIGRLTSIFHQVAIAPCEIITTVNIQVQTFEHIGFSGKALNNDNEIAQVTGVAKKILIPAV